MNRTRAILFASVLIAAVGCDHATKIAATELLPRGGFSVASDLLRFELAYNHGAFLGVGANLPAIVRKLILLGAPISDESIPVIAGMTHLRDLNLYRSRVSNSGIAKLAALPWFM